MKPILFALTFAFSTAVFAQVPANEALGRLIAPGTYAGKNGSEDCQVGVVTKTDAATVAITTNYSSDVFVLINSSKNFSFNESTGEIAAVQSLKYPHYLQGGTKILNVRAINDGQINFSISNILLDHRGNDMSTFSACTLSL